MLLTFVSPPKDQNADVRFPNSVYGKNESRCRSSQQCSMYSLDFLEGWLYDYEKPKHTPTSRSATTRFRPWRSRFARVKWHLLGKSPRGLPHLRELLLFCACVRRGANLRPNLEQTSREKIRCPLRSGRSTLFRWILRSRKWSEPAFQHYTNHTAPINMTPSTYQKWQMQWQISLSKTLPTEQNGNIQKTFGKFSAILASPNFQKLAKLAVNCPRQCR